MTDETKQSYPLDWPAGWVRTLPHARARAKFYQTKRIAYANGQGSYLRKDTLTIAQGLQRLTDELRRLRCARMVISSNLAIRQDGLPYAQQGKMLADPGIAVYFILKGRAMALACDKWQSAAENMAALAGHIEAVRASDRYGVGTIEQAFAGYKALPADSAADWRLVFGFDKGSAPSVADVKSRHRDRAKTAHPDKGGTEEGMMHVNRALGYALAELNGRA